MVYVAPIAFGITVGALLSLFNPKIRRWLSDHFLRDLRVWAVTWFWVLICMDVRKVFTVGVYFDRFGGMTTLMGVLLMITAQARSDSGIWTLKLSDDPFFKRGFTIAAIGALIWIIGDVYLQALLQFLRTVL
jgi:hypothetical protein